MQQVLLTEEESQASTSPRSAQGSLLTKFTFLEGAEEIKFSPAECNDLFQDDIWGMHAFHPQLLQEPVGLVLLRFAGNALMSSDVYHSCIPFYPGMIQHFKQKVIITVIIIYVLYV